VVLATVVRITGSSYGGVGLGHGGEAMVRKVYGHLGQVRHRAKAVEYRVEQHAAKLGDRLRALRGAEFGTTIGTTS
jgi:hypothetical protein